MSKAPKAKTRTKTGKKKTPAGSKATPRVETATPETARPQPSQPSVAPKAAKSSAAGGKGLLAVAAVLAVLVGGGYATWSYWGDKVMGKGQVERQAEAKAPPVEVATLEQLNFERRQVQDQLDRLLARMESIESAVEGVKKIIRATARPDRSAALTQRLEELEKSGMDMKSLIRRMGQLEKDSIAQADSQASSQAGLQADPRMATQTATQMTATALVLAVSNLRQAITRGDPFTEALDALKAVAGGDPDMEAGVVLLAKIAPTGAPTLAELKDRFGTLAGRIVQASREKQDSGWVARAMGRLSSLVTWRRVDGEGGGAGETEIENTSVDAIVARTEKRLKGGDLPGAVKALEGLRVHKKAGPRAASWLAAAKSRIVAERAVATLHVHAVSLLTPAKK